jgi:hypothetical protein
MKVYSYNIKLVSCCAKSRNVVYVAVLPIHLSHQTLNMSEPTRTTAAVY